MLAGPITALGATHTIGIDVGRAANADMRCPPATDVSVTYSYPLWKWVALTGRIGLARWEESRSLGGFNQDRSDGLSPVLGLNVDFGGKRLRAGISADIYPAVGDTGYVRYFGAGLRILFGGSVGHE
jgi:hypothetical protein